MARFEDGFGSRAVTEPTELCDILNTIEAIPKVSRPPIVNELEEFIRTATPTPKKCGRVVQSYTSFVKKIDFIKKPEVTWWFSILRWNVGDAIHDLRKQSKICGEEDIDSQEIITKLSDLHTRMKEFSFSEEEAKQLNTQITVEAKKEWIEARAWDFDEEELKQLKTPYDD